MLPEVHQEHIMVSEVELSHKINTRYGWCKKTIYIYIYIYKSRWEGRDHLKVHLEQSADRYVLSSHHPLSHGSPGLYNSYQALPSLIYLCNNLR